MHTTHKTSISIKKIHRERLSQLKNRSAIINDALSLYYSKLQYMQKAEKERTEKSIKQGIEDIASGDIISLPDNVTTEKDMLDFITSRAK